MPLRELRRMMGARGEAASAALAFPPSLVFGGPLGGAAPFQLALSGDGRALSFGCVGRALSFGCVRILCMWQPDSMAGRPRPALQPGGPRLLIALPECSL